MADEFARYETLRQSGACPDEIYLAAMQDGVDSITRIRLIRAVCSLSLREAKEVMLRAEGESTTIEIFSAALAWSEGPLRDCGDKLPRLRSR